MTNATQQQQMLPANIIAQQLGGANRLKAMIGAKNFFHDNDGNTLRFTFKMCSKAKLVKITLNGLDL